MRVGINLSVRQVSETLVTLVILKRQARGMGRVTLVSICQWLNQ